MIHRFKINPVIHKGHKKYVIKKRVPLFSMMEMTKNEFFPEEKNENEIILFNNINQAMEDLHQHADLNGLEEILIKICN